MNIGGCCLLETESTRPISLSFCLNQTQRTHKVCQEKMLEKDGSVNERLEERPPLSPQRPCEADHKKHTAIGQASRAGSILSEKCRIRPEQSSRRVHPRKGCDGETGRGAVDGGRSKRKQSWPWPKRTERYDRKQLHWRGKGWQKKPARQDQRGRLRCYSHYAFRAVAYMTQLDFGVGGRY